FRMLLGVSGDRDFNVGMLPLDAGNEIRRTAIAIWMRGVGRADAIRRIAAKCDDMADADVVIAADDVVDLAARGADAGQLRGRQASWRALKYAERGGSNSPFAMGSCPISA